MRVHAFLMAVPLLLGAACKPPAPLPWSRYEDALYRLARNPAELDRFSEELLAQIQAGEAARAVPQGLYAEYGYLLLLARRNGEAVVWFEKEKTAWPESRVLMDRMILMATNPKPPEANA